MIVVELSKKLLLSCNIHLRGFFFYFQKESGRGRHLRIKCFHSCVLSKQLYFPFRPSMGFTHLKHYQPIDYSGSNKGHKTLATSKFTIFGNLNISVKVRVNAIY